MSKDKKNNEDLGVDKPIEEFAKAENSEDKKNNEDLGVDKLIEEFVKAENTALQDFLQKGNSMLRVKKKQKQEEKSQAVALIAEKIGVDPSELSALL